MNRRCAPGGPGLLPGCDGPTDPWYVGSMKTLFPLAALALALGAAGCATTIDSRIRANPGLFASFPADAQEKIRQERVELGFTEDMVRIALGSPTRVTMRETENGTTMLWVYTTHDPETYSDVVPTTYYTRGKHGRLYAQPDFIWMDRTYWRERDAARIEFRNGKVVGIETSRR